MRRCARAAKELHARVALVRGPGDVTVVTGQERVCVAGFRRRCPMLYLGNGLHHLRVNEVRLDLSRVSLVLAGGAADFARLDQTTHARATERNDDTAAAWRLLGFRSTPHT